MDLPVIDWSVAGTFFGGAATALLTRFLGITKRLEGMERRIDTQSELIATLTAENHALRIKADDQARLIAELSGDNVRLAGRIAELERERDELIQRSKDLVAQWEADKARPSVLTNRPPPLPGLKGSP